MPCLIPVAIVRDYKSASGDFTHKVPCGKCPECQRTRQHQWAFRLEREMMDSSSASFITLTYEEAPLSFNDIPTLVKDDFQKFMKRLRKRTHNKLKYYAVGEYGDKSDRPHYHLILFNAPSKWLQLGDETIFNTWKTRGNYGNRNLGGHVVVAECNMATIYYTTKYMMKSRWEPQHELDDRERPFALMSKKLGESFLTTAMEKYMKDTLSGSVRLPTGTVAPLPRYFKERLRRLEPERRVTNTERNKKLLEELKNDERYQSFQAEYDHIKREFEKADLKVALQKQKL